MAMNGSEKWLKNHQSKKQVERLSKWLHMP